MRKNTCSTCNNIERSLVNAKDFLFLRIFTNPTAHVLAYNPDTSVSISYACACGVRYPICLSHLELGCQLANVGQVAPAFLQ